MKYPKERIIKALLLAPLPLLLFSALFIIIVNHEYSLYSILVVFVGHSLVYLAYCILTVPFTLIFSIILNHYRIINLLTICFSSLVLATPFFMLLGWSHTGEIPKEWWKMYTNIWTIFMAVFPGLCYWLFLISLKDKKSKNIE